MHVNGNKKSTGEEMAQIRKEKERERELPLRRCDGDKKVRKACQTSTIECRIRYMPPMYIGGETIGHRTNNVSKSILYYLPIPGGHGGMSYHDVGSQVEVIGALVRVEKFLCYEALVHEEDEIIAFCVEAESRCSFPAKGMCERG